MASDRLQPSIAIVQRPPFQGSIDNSGVLRSWEVPCPGVDQRCQSPSVPFSHCPQMSHGYCALGCIGTGALHSGRCCSHPMYPYGDSQCHPPLGPRLCLGKGGSVVATRTVEWPASGRCLVAAEQALCQLWSCVCFRGSATVRGTITRATCSVQLLVEVCTHGPLCPCLGRGWLAGVWRVGVIWPPGLDVGGLACASFSGGWGCH